MKRACTVTCLLFLWAQAVVAPSVLRAEEPGVMITGDCSSTGGIALEASMQAMQATLSAQLTTFTNKTTQTLKEQTAALQGAASSEADMQNRSANARVKAEIAAQAKLDNVGRMLYDLNPDAACCAPDASYYVQRAMENIAEANALLATKARDVGQGVSHNAQEKDMAFANAALNVEKNGAILTGSVFSEDQFSAWNDLADIMFSGIKEKRPEGMKMTNGADARYLIAETRARETRVILMEPWRMYGLNRFPQVPFKEILKWAPNVNPPVIYEVAVDSDGKVGDPSKVTKKVLGENDNISLEATLDIVGKRFTSGTYLAQVEKGSAADATKALLRLSGYEFLALNEIRKSLMLNNLMLSMQLVGQFEKFNNDTRSILSR